MIKNEKKSSNIPFSDFIEISYNDDKDISMIGHFKSHISDNISSIIERDMDSNAVKKYINLLENEKNIYELLLDMRGECIFMNYKTYEKLGWIMSYIDNKIVLDSIIKKYNNIYVYDYIFTNIDEVVVHNQYNRTYDIKVSVGVEIVNPVVYIIIDESNKEYYKNIIRENIINDILDM